MKHESLCISLGCLSESGLGDKNFKRLFKLEEKSEVFNIVPGGFLVDTPAEHAGPGSCDCLLALGEERSLCMWLWEHSLETARWHDGTGTVLILRTSVSGAQGVSRSGQVALRLRVRVRKLSSSAQYFRGSREQGRKVNPYV